MHKVKAKKNASNNNQKPLLWFKAQSLAIGSSVFAMA
jgi:hypothetical protein